MQLVKWVSIVLSIIVFQACFLMSAISATCTLSMDVLEAHYNPSQSNDPKNDALCFGKPDGFFVYVDQCVPDFYGCVSGAFFALSCDNAYEPGYVYDPIKCSCVVYDQSTCKAPSTPSTTTTPETLQTSTTPKNIFSCSDKEDGSYPIGSLCSSNYFICVDGIFYPQNCPGTGNVFDAEKSACVSYDKASCMIMATTIAPVITCPSPGVFAIAGECSARYYSCASDGGEPSIILCPDTSFIRFFDCTTSTCKSADAVPCQVEGSNFAGCPPGSEL